jgi:DNA-binding PadR family transcriptional regulator
VALVEKAQLVSQLSPPLDVALAQQLVDEFVSMERRYIQRDWEPAELDGGHFCEVLARILYHQDSNQLDVSRAFSDCMNYIENGSVFHALNKAEAHQFVRVIRAIYQFRNHRGVAHVSLSYQPNQMDARLVMECVRWCMNETLRIFWNGDRETVAKAIRELLQFDVPAVGVFEDLIQVQRTKLTTEEEILILLHYAGEQGFSRNEVGRYCHCSAPSVTKALQRLSASNSRQVIQLSNGNYRLTDLGSKRIRENLADKLLID